ncbi:MAG TPA: DUF6599 family protein [Terriglobales bacterium]
MKLLHRVLAVALLAGLSVPTFADKPEASSSPLLPHQFAGWQLSGPGKPSSDPAVADPVNATVLKEYGFNDFESATYTRDDGRKLMLKAIRFADASGAYGAFTFYKSPPMLVEKIGDQGASLNERVLFYRGNMLVDAVFQQLSAMSAAELRELSDNLPVDRGNTQTLPGLPRYLPKDSYVKNSAKYILGPATLDKINAPIAAEFVDFPAGAEVVLGDYTSSGGGATLELIAYPTPQIAAEHLRRIDAARQSTVQSASSPANLPANLYDKRSGPIVVVASGALSPEEARSLLAAVNYDANVTWNENTYLSKRDNMGNLLINVIYLCAIIIGFALVAGLAFGGLRVFFRRIFLERLLGVEDDVRFIALHLGEAKNPPSAGASSSAKTI